MNDQSVIVGSSTYNVHYSRNTCKRNYAVESNYIAATHNHANKGPHTMLDRAWNFPENKSADLRCIATSFFTDALAQIVYPPYQLKLELSGYRVQGLIIAYICRHSLDYYRSVKWVCMCIYTYTKANSCQGVLYGRKVSDRPTGL